MARRRPSTPTIRLDEVPQLADIADHLIALNIDDVRVCETPSRDWLGAVFLLRHGDRPEGLPWWLGSRPTRDDAIGALEELLRGLVEGRLQAQALHPSNPQEDDGVVRGELYRRWYDDRLAPHYPVKTPAKQSGRAVSKTVRQPATYEDTIRLSRLRRLVDASGVLPTSDETLALRSIAAGDQFTFEALESLLRRTRAGEPRP
jgi:hypothetical protein